MHTLPPDAHHIRPMPTRTCGVCGVDWITVSEDLCYTCPDCRRTPPHKDPLVRDHLEQRQEQQRRKA